MGEVSCVKWELTGVCPHKAQEVVTHQYFKTFTSTGQNNTWDATTNPSAGTGGGPLDPPNISVVGASVLRYSPLLLLGL